MADARSNPQAARQITLLSAMELDDSGDPTQAYQPVFLSHDPLVVRFPAFLSADECAMLIEMAQPKLRPATVIHPVTGQLVTDPVRTSFAAAFPLLEETPFLHAVNRRIAAASRSHVEQGEPAQILSYSSGQQYHLHSDAILGEANQRIQTFLIYLNDDFQGGETFFPYGKLSLRPARGDAICFSNVDTAMRPAATAQHAGLPVTTGRKYLLSRWIRRNPLNLGGPLTN
jgi:prolyl 4-hydroxylase